MNRTAQSIAIACSLATIAACATSLKTESFAPDANKLGAALLEARGQARLQTISQGRVSLSAATIEGDAICGLVVRPGENARTCFARSDIETVTLDRWKDDAGTTTMVYGVMAGCLVLLPLCLAKGASGVGQ